MAFKIKMSREERAKQFMPFGALKGYPEALAEKEKRCLPRRELSEEMLVQLDRQLAGLEVGDRIRILYYHRGEYRTLTGVFAGVDAGGRLHIGEKVIPAANIYELTPDGATL